MTKTPSTECLKRQQTNWMPNSALNELSKFGVLRKARGNADQKGFCWIFLFFGCIVFCNSCLGLRAKRMPEVRKNKRKLRRVGSHQQLRSPGILIQIFEQMVDLRKSVIKMKRAFVVYDVLF